MRWPWGTRWFICRRKWRHLTLLFARIVADAGVPAGAYNVVTGLGVEIGDDLTSSPDIDFVSFTVPRWSGSPRRNLCAEPHAAYPRTRRQEPDGHPRRRRSGCGRAHSGAFGFMFAGQACISSSRFYVERPLYDAFVERFAMVVGKVGMGDLRNPGTVIAPIISERQRSRVTHIEDAQSKGARVVAGGGWEGNRCQPTLLTDVSEEMTVCRAETFGPVTSIYPIDSYEEGLEGQRHRGRPVFCDLRQGHQQSHALRPEHQRGHVPHQRLDHPRRGPRALRRQWSVRLWSGRH